MKYMSTSSTPTTEITIDSTTLVTTPDTTVDATSNSHKIDIAPPQEVASVKKEYSIVGDAFYAGINSDVAPTWLTNLIDAVVGASVANGLTDYDLLVQDVRNAIDSIDIASNTYVEQINFNTLVNGIVGTHLTTLNAAIGDTFATITELEVVRVDSESALALKASDLQAEFASNINARITTVESAYASADQVNADSVTALALGFIDQESSLSGTAYAVEGLQTYVGLDGSSSAPTGLGMLSRINILEKQTDGVIEFNTNTYDVMIGIEEPNNNTDNDQLDVTKEPYATWISEDVASATEESRASHVGDVYIMYSDDVNGTRTYVRSYKFIKTIVDSTSPYATDTEGYTWAVISDTDAQVAYTIALQAKDLADNKRRVFTDEPYGPYENGDLWVRSIGGSSQVWRSNTNRATGYEVVEWQVASTDDQAAADIVSGTNQIDLSNHVNSLGWQVASEVSNTASSVLSTWVETSYDNDQLTVQGELDGKVESYFSVSEPYDAATALVSKDGDLWYDTTVGSKKLYRMVFSSNSWEQLDDQVAIDAASAASTAQSTADGKIVTFISVSEPTAEGVGDVWIDSDNNNHMYRWNGSLWVSIRDTENDSALVGAISSIGNIETSIDGKVDTYYSNTEPYTAASGSIISDGDLWYDLEGNKLYKYTFSTLSWDSVEDSDALLAIANASTAQSTADGKVTTFYQTNEPTAEGLGDLWIDSDNDYTYYWNAVAWVRFRDDSALDAFLVATYANDKLATQNQIDGKSISYFSSTEPYTAISGANYQNGDTWYNTTSKELKVFDFSVPEWILITDPYIQGAYDNAATAQTSADGKIRNFTSEPTAPFDTGDTWMEGTTGDIYVCKLDSSPEYSHSTDKDSYWMLASKYTDDSSVVLLNSGLVDGTIAIDLSSATVDGTDSIATYVSEQIDLEVVVYSGTDHTAQEDMKTDDIYIEKAVNSDGAVDVDVTNTYKYNGTIWVEIGSNSNLTALADLADGKRTIYSNVSNDVPAGLVNDIWIPTTGSGDITYIPGEVYQYTTLWVLATKYTENLDSFANTINNTVIPGLELQIDGKIDSYYQLSTDGDPDVWDTVDDSKHSGDILHYTDTSESFYFDDAVGTWVAITNKDALQAIQDAATAQSTADGKLSEFYAWSGTTAPSDYIIPAEDDKYLKNGNGEFLTAPLPAGVVTTNSEEYVVVAAAAPVTVSADHIVLWYKSDNLLYKRNGLTWGSETLVPTVAGSGAFIAHGDLMTVFDPTDGDESHYWYNSGNWVTNGPLGIVSKSRKFLDLENDVVGVNGHVAKTTSNLEITSKAYANEKAIGVENKFTYDSTILLGGSYYNSGFGLNSSGVTQTADGLTPATSFDSEFWVNAERFVLKSPTYPGIEATFSITSTGIRLGVANTEATANQSDTDANSTAQDYANAAASTKWFPKSSNVEIRGLSIFNVSGGGSWGSVASTPAQVGGCVVSANAPFAGARSTFIGLSSTQIPSSFSEINFAIYLSNGVVRTRAGNINEQSHGSFSVGDAFSVIYDGKDVKYHHNGVVLRTYTTTTDRKFYGATDQLQPSTTIAGWTNATFVGLEGAGALADAALTAANLYADTNFIDSIIYSTDIGLIQGQIDGNITTWFLSGVPTLANLPASDWDTDSLKNVHLGDIYYDDVTEFSYRFKLVSGVYSWGLIKDSDITTAITNAATAQDTADGKRRVFVTTPVVPYDVGDLWDTGTGFSRCTNLKLPTGSYSSADWQSAATDATSAATAANEADKTDGTIGGWLTDNNSMSTGDKTTSEFTSSGVTLYNGGSIHTPWFYSQANGAAFRGDISAATGTFSGDLSASGGSFSGSLSGATLETSSMVIKTDFNRLCPITVRSRSGRLSSLSTLSSSLVCTLNTITGPGEGATGVYSPLKVARYVTDFEFDIFASTNAEISSSGHIKFKVGYNGAPPTLVSQITISNSQGSADNGASEMMVGYTTKSTAWATVTFEFEAWSSSSSAGYDRINVKMEAYNDSISGNTGGSTRNYTTGVPIPDYSDVGR
jgi:phage-related protein